MAILSTLFYTFVPLIVLLGILIFVHELGHFSVAKYFGVRVEVFSLGFGRKILRKKWGDTEYCVSAIPFGGYVKMYGDDPTAVVPENQRRYSFSHKPVGPRIAVVLAGPLMNAFFALLVFSVIAGVGEEALSPQVGDVTPTSQAYKIGFRPGDKITKINGQEIQRWDEFKQALENKNGQIVHVDLLREGKPLSLEFTTPSVPNKNVLNDAKEIGDVEGLTYLSRAPVVGMASPQSPAAKAGIKSFDLIESLDGKKVSTWNEAERLLRTVGPHTVVRVEASRFKEINRPDSEKSNLTFNVLSDNKGSLGLESSELYLAKIVDGSPAQLAGLEVGDRVLKLNGQAVNSWEQVIRAVQGYRPENEPIKIEFMHAGFVREVNVIPRLMNQASATGEEMKNFALGVITGLAFAPPDTFTARETSFGKIIKRGFTETVTWTVLTAKSFSKLIQRKVSAKSIGGPLMIGKLASDTWKIGLSAFLKIMGIISINLFLLNLLPIPVLDGGHLLFFTIELFKGSPLSFRKLEIMQQMGMVLLLALMVFAVFNDISRFFFSTW